MVLLWSSRDASIWATRSSKCSLTPEDDIDDSLSCVGAGRTVRVAVSLLYRDEIGRTETDGKGPGAAQST